MPETEKLPSQPKEESVPTANLQERIEEAAHWLRKDLKRERLPRTLCIGAPKNITGASIANLVQLLNSATADFEENTAGLKRAADAMGCTPEELFDSQSLPNAWRTGKWRRETEDLIAELESVLNLYCGQLEREVDRKDKNSSEKRALAEAGAPDIPELSKSEDILIEVLKDKFLADSKNTVSYVAREDFFDSAVKIIKRKLPGKKNEESRVRIVEILTAGEELSAGELLNILDYQSYAQIGEIYLKARLLSNLSLDRSANEKRFWNTIRMVQALRTNEENIASVPELEKATYPGDKFDVPQLKKKWRQETARKIEVQKELAADDVDFLNKISAVLIFLAGFKQQEQAQMDLFETPAEPLNYADALPFRAEIKQTVSGMRGAEDFKQKLSDVFNGDCSAGARRPITSADWREIALNARAAALKAINDQWRARGSAKEGWAMAARETVRRTNAEKIAEEAQAAALEEQRRRCEVEAANATLRERLERALEKIDHGSTGSP